MPRRRLNHCRLAHPRSVKIDVCPFLSRLSRHIQIENLHDIAHEIRQLPIILNLLLIVLDLLMHRQLLVRQPLELALHDARVVLEQTPSRDDVACARVEDLVVQNICLFLLFFLPFPFCFGFGFGFLLLLFLFVVVLVGVCHGGVSIVLFAVLFVAITITTTIAITTSLFLFVVFLPLTLHVIQIL